MGNGKDAKNDEDPFARSFGIARRWKTIIFFLVSAGAFFGSFFSAMKGTIIENRRGQDTVPVVVERIARLDGRVADIGDSVSGLSADQDEIRNILVGARRSLSTAQKDRGACVEDKAEDRHAETMGVLISIDEKLRKKR